MSRHCPGFEGKEVKLLKGLTTPSRREGSRPNKANRHTPNENGYVTDLLHRNLVENNLACGRPLASGLLRRMGYDFPFAAFTAAQRFRDASAIALLPAALIFRFGLAGTVAGFAGSDSPRIFAHRRCWASFILRRASAENFRRLGEVPAAGAAVLAGPPARRRLSSAICWSIRVFCDS